MSTFTTINTAIRDAGTMGRLLRSLPGARVDENVVIPSKWGGSYRVAFRVAFGDSPVSAWGFLGQALRGKVPDVRLFYVDRADNGTFTIEISHDLDSHDAMQRIVESALASAPAAEALLRQQREVAERQERDRAEQQARLAEERRLVQKRQEEERLAEETRRRHLREDAARLERERVEEQARLAEEHRLAQKRQEEERLAEERRQKQLRENAARLERERVEEQRREARRQEARSAAAPILAQLDARRAQAGQATTAPATSPTSPTPEEQAASDAWVRALTQQYAREKVLEQLDDVQRQYGVSLGGIETLEDGTIEITLRG